MRLYKDILDWIDDQHTQMLDQVIAWSNINTFTFNYRGIEALTLKLIDALDVLHADITQLQIPPIKFIDKHGLPNEIPLAPLILVSKRMQAQRRALFITHLDTAYAPQNSLQESFLIEGRMLTGQGVSNSKGGISVLIKSLEAFERSELSKNIGWAIIINTDEHMDCCGSGWLFRRMAQRSHIGFVFEPCLPNGHLIGHREGVGYFTFTSSKNVTQYLIEQINNLQQFKEVKVKTFLEGDVIKCEIRLDSIEEQIFVENEIKRIVENVSEMFDVEINVNGGFNLPPKETDSSLYKMVKECGDQIGLNIVWEHEGRPSSANILAATGLSTIDSLGVQGGVDNGHKEFIYIDSLRERTKLSVLSLLHWAQGGLV